MKGIHYEVRICVSGQTELLDALLNQEDKSSDARADCNHKHQRIIQSEVADVLRNSSYKVVDTQMDGWYPICLDCGKRVDNIANYKYCPFCGQKL